MNILPGMLVYKAETLDNGKYTVAEYPTDEEAVAACESVAGGTVTKFRAHQNMPNCLPEVVLKSCSLKVFEAGKWRDVNIFGG